MTRCDHKIESKSARWYLAVLARPFAKFVPSTKLLRGKLRMVRVIVTQNDISARKLEIIYRYRVYVLEKAQKKVNCTMVKIILFCKTR